MPLANWSSKFQSGTVKTHTHAHTGSSSTVYNVDRLLRLHCTKPFVFVIILIRERGDLLLYHNQMSLYSSLSVFVLVITVSQVKPLLPH